MELLRNLIRVTFNFLYLLFLLIFWTALWNRCCYCPHFVERTLELRKVNLFTKFTQLIRDRSSHPGLWIKPRVLFTVSLVSQTRNRELLPSLYCPGPSSQGPFSTRNWLTDWLLCSSVFQAFAWGWLSGTDFSLHPVILPATRSCSLYTHSPGLTLHN